MDADRLAQIRARASLLANPSSELTWTHQLVTVDVPDLLAEVERLTALIAELLEVDSCWHEHDEHKPCVHMRAEKALGRVPEAPS